MGKSNKKILFISHDASRSGAPLTLLALLKAIKTCHPEIESYLLLLDYGVMSEEFGQYATILHVKKRKNLVTKVKRLFWGVPYKDDYSNLKSLSFECIFANSVASLSKAVILKHELGCRLLLYVHEVSLVMKKIKVQTNLLQQCDVLIAASEATKKNLICNYSVSAEKINVVYPPQYNVINYSAIQSDCKNRQKLTIGLSGTGCWGKGIDLLPFVIEDVVNTHPEIDCQFMWVGHLTDETIINLDYDLSRLNIRDKLTIIGEVEFPWKYYSQFGIFLVLSREESFSLACVECIELGIPIICMEGTLGITELIGSESIVSVPYLNINCITEAISRIASNEALRTTLINNARQQLSSNYSSEKSFNSLVKLLEA